jgi:hypothetical protein
LQRADHIQSASADGLIQAAHASLLELPRQVVLPVRPAVFFSLTPAEHGKQPKKHTQQNRTADDDAGS